MYDNDRKILTKNILNVLNIKFEKRNDYSSYFLTIYIQTIKIFHLFSLF